VRTVLVEAGAAVRLTAPDWGDAKWVAGENLHVTLSFLGTLSGPVLDAVREELTSRLASEEAFDLYVDQARAAGSRGRSAMVWATFRDPEAKCAALAGTVRSAAAACGIEQLDRRFVPHVTLARARRQRSVSPEALVAANSVLRRHDVSMSVLSVTLFASTLTPRGPIYERIDSWTFAPHR
jgi:2'-5' RNA ligase